MRTLGIYKRLLNRLYADLGKTDSEIADFFGCDRTTIVHLRKKYNINARKSTGKIGEEMVLKELKSRGFSVKDMNKKDQLHVFDLLLDDEVRIEVKSAKVSDNGYFYITFTEKSGNQNVVSDTRIQLGNGRTRKLYSETCDFIICAGLAKEIVHFWVVPSEAIPNNRQSIALPENPFVNSKYKVFRENWELIKKPDGQHQTIKKYI